MNIPTETELVARIKAFLGRHGMAPSRFGREATGEPQLLDSIENKGRSPSLKVVHRVLAYMAEEDAKAGFHSRDHDASATNSDLTASKRGAPPPFVPAPGRADPLSSGASPATSSMIPERSSSSAASPSCPSSEAEAA